ncbi:MAG TPA: DUF2637 domain-containing protein [Streptomyces sp.]|nr:DUF2637 domain-containing protein [Streptomyces sp.]
MNRKGKILLVLALVGVVGMAFRVSWNALRDVAKAVGADATAATLYPIVVDGLMALALVAALVLTDKADKQRALKMLATYTLASLVLNYVHGLVPDLHGGTAEWGRLANWDPANWVLVLLATSLPVGSIYFGSDLVAKVLHHQPAPIPTVDTYAEESPETVSYRSTAGLAESTPTPVVANPLPMPRPVAVGFLKSNVALKPIPSSAPAIEPRAVAAESARPRRATGRVPEIARSPRLKRTPADLLTEARAATREWPDEKLTAEGIRLAVHTSPKNARMLREALRAERDGTTKAA